MGGHNLLRQGLAIRGSGHQEMQGNLLQLLLLRVEDCPQLKSWISDRKYFSPEIVNEQIALMGLSVLRKILDEIRSATYFSIIADEASDISNKEQLSICIRWVDKDFQIHEDPLEMIQVPETRALTLTNAIKDCLVRFSLPVGQCRGQAYDGASNMSGYLSGVATRIQNDVPSAVYVHCLAHCTNLCLQSVGRQCSSVRDSLDLVMELSQLIRFSPKRSSLFQNLQDQLATSAPSLKPLCPTRWTVRVRVQSILFSPTTLFFVKPWKRSTNQLTMTMAEKLEVCLLC